MSISLASAGTPATGSTGLNPAHPLGTVVGRVGVIRVVTKPDTATINTPANWTSIASGTGGTGSQGVDTGPMAVAVFYRVFDGSGADAAPALTITSGNASQAVIDHYQVTSAFDAASFAGTTGADATHLTDWSATGGADLSLNAGDLLLGVSACCSNATGGVTISSRAVAADGATFGTIGNTRQASTNTGNDCTLDTWDAPVTGGPSTSAPTYSASHSANNSGVTAFVKLVEASTGATTANAEATAATIAAQSVLFGIPTGLVVTAVAWNRVDLSWSPVAWARAYDVARDGGIVARVTAPAYSDTSLLPRTTYEFKVRAVH